MSTTFFSVLQIGAAISGAVVASIICPTITPIAIMAIATSSIATQTLFTAIGTDIKCLKESKLALCALVVIGAAAGTAISILVMGLLGLSLPLAALGIACGLVAAFSAVGVGIGLLGASCCTPKTIGT